jgi:hypothetical protein
MHRARLAFASVSVNNITTLYAGVAIAKDTLQFSLCGCPTTPGAGPHPARVLPAPARRRKNARGDADRSDARAHRALHRMLKTHTSIPSPPRRSTQNPKREAPAESSPDAGVWGRRGPKPNLRVAVRFQCESFRLIQISMRHANCGSKKPASQRPKSLIQKPNSEISLTAPSARDTR